MFRAILLQSIMSQLNRSFMYNTHGLSFLIAKQNWF